MFAPEIIIKNAVVENDRNNSDSYVITLNFSVIDQYNDSGLGSWIENQDVRKYIKYTTIWNSTNIESKYLPDLNNTDIQNYLVSDFNGGRRYEYPVSHKISNISKSINNIIIQLTPSFDLQKYVVDKGLSSSGVSNENGDTYSTQIIKNSQILNVSEITDSNQNIIGSLTIINNVIIEDIEKLQINLSFVDSFEKNIVSIIETDTNKNKDISAYVTDLFISKNEDNTHSFLFGIDKKKIVQTKTQLGNYITAISDLPQLQTQINNLIQFTNIYVTKKQVKKVKSYSKLGNQDSDYISHDSTQSVLFTLNDTNKINISNNSSYDFYSFTDTSASNDNTTFQYTLTIQLQDSFKEFLVGLQLELLNNITILEQYYEQISIPVSNSFGYYDLKTNTFKNNADLLVPSNLTQITTSFSVLYFFISAINKNNLDTAFIYLNSTSLVSALQKSLSVSTSSLYVIKKTIEIMKNFASTVEKLLDIQLVDIQPERDGSQTIKIGTNSTEIIDLTYVFNNVVENTYYNNFKENKILIVQPSQEINNFPTLTTSKLASFNRTGPLGEDYSPSSSGNILLGEETDISEAIGIDSKESRLLISYINNLMLYLEEKDVNITTLNTDEASSNLRFSSNPNILSYKTLIGDIISKKGVELIGYQNFELPEEDTPSFSSNSTFTATDPLTYAISSPRDYPINTRGSIVRIKTLQGENSEKIDSITRLLNYLICKINLSNIDSFAKKDGDTVINIIGKYIPKYNIQYLDSFEDNIKNYNWINFNNVTFSSLPLRTTLFCRLIPTITSDQSNELKKIIGNLHVPYMYFILNKDSNEYENSVPFTIPFSTDTRGLTVSSSIALQGRFINTSEENLSTLSPFNSIQVSNNINLPRSQTSNNRRIFNQIKLRIR